MRVMYWSYLLVFMIGLTSFSVMLSNAPDREDMLIGTWKESSWNYEEAPVADSLRNYTTGKQEKLGGEIFKVHKAETWVFSKGGRLQMICKEQQSMASWSVKGRGHVLQIKHPNNYVEHYQLSEVNGRKLILNYECSAQAKGIARLSFLKK